MWILCDECRTSYEIRDELGGRLSRCRCGATIMLPVPDAGRLIEWASTVTWPLLFKFVTRGGARGHAQSTVTKLIRVFEQRREAEEWRLRGIREAQKHVAKELHRQQFELEEQQRLSTMLRERQHVVSMLELSATDFELFVADVFRAQGYEAFAVGGTSDGGVDVEIYDKDGESLWAIAQCKRYDGSKIAAKHIREFAGAFGPSNAKQAIYITTGGYTRQATAAARNYPWMQLYDGDEFAAYVASTYKRFDIGTT